MPSLPEGYHVETVYGQLNQPLIGEIVRFWLSQRAIRDANEARRRVREVVDIIRNDRGELVGLNSVYPGAYRNRQDIYLFYRLYIRLADRKPGIARYATHHVVELLKGRPDIRKGVKGLIVVTENPKLTREVARRLLESIGFDYDGQGPKGHDVWRVNFSSDGIQDETPVA
jgi:hypothetical protein